MPWEDARPLPGYISHARLVRNGLVCYSYPAITHKLLRCFIDNDMTFQLFDIIVCDGKLRFCNVYSVPGRINLPALPTASSHCMVNTGDFSARNPALGNVSPLLEP